MPICEGGEWRLDCVEAYGDNAIEGLIKAQMVKNDREKAQSHCRSAH